MLNKILMVLFFLTRVFSQHNKRPFNNYVKLTAVGGVHHFVTYIVKPIVINNRLMLGTKTSKLTVT